MRSPACQYTAVPYRTAVSGAAVSVEQYHVTGARRDYSELQQSSNDKFDL